jgi:cyclophilin family peptidyl-prolyl cis-trans isomerase
MRSFIALAALTMGLAACNESGSSDGSAASGGTVSPVTAPKPAMNAAGGGASGGVAPSAMNPAPAPAPAAATPKVTGKPVVIMKTSMGTVKIELDAERAPISVENFLGYVDKKFYDGTIFHRVINGFMIQGGGFDQEMHQKPTAPPIKNEGTNGLTNDRGTIAMARTAILDSATAQFYINVVNNPMLNYPSGGGYAVFGKVIEGMDVVDKIKAVPTTMATGDHVPVTPVVIESIRRAS